MPLQFEIRNKDSILCFVPSGHRVGDQFVNLEEQEGYNCWYHTTYRLISMCYTQKGFELSTQSPVVRAVVALRDKFTTTYRMSIFCEYLVQALFKKNATAPDKIFAFLEKDLTPSRLAGTIANIIKTMNKDKLTSKAEMGAHRLAIDHFEQFKQNCVAIAKTVIDARINLLSETAETAIKQCSDNYFMAQDNQSYEEFFAIPAVKSRLGEHDLTALAAAKTKTLDIKRTTYFDCMWDLHMRENGIARIVRSTTPDQPWAAMIKELLERNGPVIMAGYVGCGYYEDVPKRVGKLASVELLGFAKDSYKPNAIAHTVLIIGIVKDKVIFLDPEKPAPASGTRQAYVMSADTFMARVIQFQESIYGPDTMIYSQIDPRRIDTTLELMKDQTAAGVSSEVVAVAAKASLQVG